MGAFTVHHETGIRMRQASRCIFRRVDAVWAVVALVILCGCTSDHLPSSSAQNSIHQSRNPDKAVEGIEAEVPGRAQEALDGITESWGAFDAFSSAEYDIVARRLTLFWFGDVPVALDDLLRDLEADGFSFAVVQTLYTGAELRAEANRLQDLQGDVASSAPRAQGDGVTITIENYDPSMEPPGAAELGINSAYPLFTEAGYPIPLS